jgi:hypothetical protein
MHTKLTTLLMTLFLTITLPAFADDKGQAGYTEAQAIAAAQGRFAGVYEMCGRPVDKQLIGGSAEVWKQEMLQRWKFSATEQSALSKIFDKSVSVVRQEQAGCKNWGQVAVAAMQETQQASRRWAAAEQASSRPGPKTGKADLSL